MSVTAWHSPVGVDQSLPAPRVIRPSNDAPWMSDPELRSLARAIVEARNAGQDDSLLLRERYLLLRQLLEQERPTAPLQPELRTLGPLTVDLDQRRAWVNGIQINPIGGNVCRWWPLLRELLSANQKPVSYRALVTAGWGVDLGPRKTATSNLKKMVAHLRVALEATGELRLAGVTSVGYVLLDMEGLKP